MAANSQTFAAFAKSVMSRLLPLTLAERAEMQVLINQGIDPIEARALVQQYVRKDAGFDESAHPRSENGKFGEGSGGAAGGAGGGGGASGAGGKSGFHTSEEHFTRAERHFTEAKTHQGLAQQAREKGDARRADVHDRVAAHANASAKRELTLERDSHESINRGREAKGEARVAHDDERHAALMAQHAENRGSIRSADAKGDKAQNKAATGHTQSAEASLGKAKAAAAKGDKEGEKAHKESARASANQADTMLKQKPAAGAEAEKAHNEAQLRNGATQELLHPGVDARSLRAAEKSHGRAQAHEKASRAHAEAGHTARAAHHATEAAHANHETGKHLAEFGKLIAEVADESLSKSADAKPGMKADVLTRAYLKAFFHSAEERLPKWQQKHLKGRARRAIDKEQLKKDGLLVADVHVPVPLARNKVAEPQTSKLPKPLPHIRLLKNDAAEIAYVNEAINLQDPTHRELDRDDDGDGSEAGDVALEANRLVQGMDMQLADKAVTPEVARHSVSRMLRERPGYYDTVGANADILGDTGLMLDLGSGQSRAMGHLGIDMHPYDYGTVLWDLDLGIPFPDASARAVRMTHSLHPILDAYGTPRSPVPLLLEVQRVLKEGGQLYYEGPEALYEKGDPWPLPGLAIISDSLNSDLSPDSNAPVRQVFRRVPLRVPAFPGADPLFTPAPPMSLDAAMAMLALNASPAEMAMANLVAKAEEPRIVPIVKADNEKQICYGEVLNPLTVDSQNDWLTAADIEKAAHDYMMSSRVIGSEHGKPIGAQVVESFVAPQDLSFVSPAGPVEVPKGTWLIGVKIQDPKEWAKVKSGEYSGFSVGGFGVREPGLPDAMAA